MQRAAETAQRQTVRSTSVFSVEAQANVGRVEAVHLDDFKVIRRNGSVVSFEPGKIAIAMTKAFLAISGGQGAASARVRELVEQMTQSVIAALLRNKPAG